MLRKITDTGSRIGDENELQTIHFCCFSCLYLSQPRSFPGLFHLRHFQGFFFPSLICSLAIRCPFYLISFVRVLLQVCFSLVTVCPSLPLSFSLLSGSLSACLSSVEMSACIFDWLLVLFNMLGKSFLFLLRLKKTKKTLNTLTSLPHENSTFHLSFIMSKTNYRTKVNNIWTGCWYSGKS